MFCILVVVCKCRKNLLPHSNNCFNYPNRVEMFEWKLNYNNAQDYALHLKKWLNLIGKLLSVNNWIYEASILPPFWVYGPTNLTNYHENRIIMIYSAICINGNDSYPMIWHNTILCEYNDKREDNSSLEHKPRILRVLK